MKFPKLNLISNIYFIFLLLFGVGYLYFLIYLLVKTAPGLVMFLIFVANSLQDHYSLLEVKPLDVLLVSTLINLISQYLVFRFIKACRKSINSIAATKKYVEKIKANKKLITSPFTFGFLNPEVYLPTNLSDNHSKDEVKAITLHEEKHQRYRDPLKKIIVNLIADMFPKFPTKKYIFGYNETLFELSADAYAEDVLQARKPIVSALMKEYLRFDSDITITGFANSQNERISVLVGKKKIAPMSGLVLISIFLFSTMVGLNSLESQNLFYSCPHINLCLESILPFSMQMNGPSTDSLKTVMSSHN